MTALRGQAQDRSLGVDLTAHVLGLTVMWLAYAWVRSRTIGSDIQALANASRVLDLESSLGLSFESDMQSLVRSPRAFFVANVYYLVHFPVTIAAVMASFVCDRQRSFVVLRNALVAVTGVGLLLHVAVPLAPPRMLEGFIDAGATYGPDPYSISGSHGANQFAAMPSLHVAWAVLVAYGAWHLVANKPLRFLAISHPISTAMVVVTTGHHFVADILIGAALALVALGLSARVRGNWTETY